VDCHVGKISSSVSEDVIRESSFSWKSMTLRET
jgi:hypothetical protein